MLCQKSLFAVYADIWWFSTMYLMSFYHVIKASHDLHTPPEYVCYYLAKITYISKDKDKDNKKNSKYSAWRYS